MDITPFTLFLLPAGLGLLGFIEPCTVGGHLVFLSVQAETSRSRRTTALAAFVIARALAMGAAGAAIVWLGDALIEAQTALWLIFGLLYLAIGAAILSGRGGLLRRRLRLAPESWARARSPLALGLAFGLNIPACAAPILFGLIGLAVSEGSAQAGFVMMAVFGLALSAPLIPISLAPRLIGWTTAASDWMRGPGRAILGAVFALLGLWSIWFGLHVDPADWSGR